jgi:EAL domain-containing protein (putative c-di-GMP-specific phosphodiesterase class I)
MPIGEFVLESACRQLGAWGKGRPKLMVSVNASPRQLQEPEFIAVVERILHKHGIEPGNLQLEITEGLLQEDDDCIRAVAELQAMGVHVALDDFGTGYSSLASIRRLPIDSLKIDQSFVAGVSGENADAALVSAAISFAKAVGLQLTAEGIETAQQLAALRELGCELGQGFFLARPLAPEDIDRLLGESADEASARFATAFGSGRQGLGSPASE